MVNQISQSESKFKLGVIFDPNVNLSDCNIDKENPNIVIGKTGQLHKLAELLNEAHSLLYNEKNKDGETRQSIKVRKDDISDKESQ